MDSLTTRRGFLCFFLAWLISIGKADTCSPESHGSCANADPTTLLQSRVAVTEAAREAASSSEQGGDGKEEVGNVEDDGDQEVDTDDDSEDTYAEEEELHNEEHLEDVEEDNEEDYDDTGDDVEKRTDDEEDIEAHKDEGEMRSDDPGMEDENDPSMPFDLATLHDDDVEDDGDDDETDTTLLDIEAGGSDCQKENQLRKELFALFKSGRHKSTAPVFVRAAFHDAIDENNLLEKSDGIWTHAPGNYGGMDGCLYSPLSKGTTGKPSPTHNWGLKQSLLIAAKLAKKAKKYGLCTSLNDCTVDMLALGAVFAIEMAGGPMIPMEWGRNKGNCKNMITKGKKKPALRDAPSLRDMDDALHFRKAFQSLGFNAQEQAALMGAHSFGKVQPAACGAVFQNSQKGAFCNKRDQLDPVVNKSNLVENGCKPKVGVVSKCWTERKYKGKTVLYPVSEFGGSKKRAKKQHKIRKRTEASGMHRGNYWDRTPDKFDNDYFKLFAEEDFNGKDVCCGKRGGHKVGKDRCNWRGKTMQNRLTGAKAANGPCDISWCRTDNGGRSHMKSTKVWAEVDHDFVCASRGCVSNQGETRRMIRIPGDWALLGHTDTLKAVKEFAEDETKFFSTFVDAYTKVLRKGHATLAPVCDTGEAATAAAIAAAPPATTAPKIIEDKEPPRKRSKKRRGKGM